VIYRNIVYTEGVVKVVKPLTCNKPNTTGVGSYGCINLKRRKARIFITNRPIKTPRVCVWQPYEPTPVVLGLLQVRGLTTLTTPSVYTILRYITHYYWICDVHLLLVESKVQQVICIYDNKLYELIQTFVCYFEWKQNRLSLFFLCKENNSAKYHVY
jgi:hypothetical protein